MTDVEVVVEIEVDGAVVAKMSTPAWEVNVRASRAELDQLATISTADWATRGSIRAGTAAGAPVFWSADDGLVTLLIGADDEMWDIAVTMPTAAVQDLCRQLADL